MRGAGRKRMKYIFKKGLSAEEARKPALKPFKLPAENTPERMERSEEEIFPKTSNKKEKREHG